MGMGEFLATRCPCCGTTDAKTRGMCDFAWRRGVPAAVQRTQKRAVCAILLSIGRHRSTSIDPQYTRPPERLNACVSIRHQVGKQNPLRRRQRLPNGHRDREGRPPRCYVYIRHESIATKRYSYTSHTLTHERCGPHACVKTAPTETGWLLPSLRRASAAITLGRNKSALR